MRWPLQPLQPLQKTQLQPPFGPSPFGPSVGSLCHSWFTRTNLSYRFPMVSYFWNFRHRLARYYWYKVYSNVDINIQIYLTYYYIQKISIYSMLQPSWSKLATNPCRCDCARKRYAPSGLHYRDSWHMICGHASYFIRSRESTKSHFDHLECLVLLNREWMYKNIE